MNVVGALSWGEGTPSGEKGSPMRKVIERWRGEGHMLRQKKAEQTCCRLGNEDGCQPPGLHDGLSSLPGAILLLFASENPFA